MGGAHVNSAIMFRRSKVIRPIDEAKSCILYSSGKPGSVERFIDDKGYAYRARGSAVDATLGFCNRHHKGAKTAGFCIRE